MDDAAKIVREGFERACSDFTGLVSSLGFVRERKLHWTRRRGAFIEAVHLHRGGSTYKATNNYSVNIRMHFSMHLVENADLNMLNGPSTELLRDDRGYAYHLRFNALTGSTYDRCINDLMKVMQEHGLPWFGAQSALPAPQDP